MSTDATITYDADFHAAEVAARNYQIAMVGIVGGITAAFAVAGVVAAVQGIRTVIANMQEWSAEAAKAQETDVRLTQAIKNAGDAFEFTNKQILEYADGLQQVTAFSGDSIKQALKTLVQFKLAGQVFEDASKLALDMAASMGVDAAQAANQLGSSLANPIKGLKQLKAQGLITGAQAALLTKEFEQTGDKAKVQGQIIELLGVKFGGFAAAMADTTNGLKARIADAFGGIKEELGAVVNSYLDELLPVIREALELIKDWAKAFRESFKADGLDGFQSALIDLSAVVLATFQDWGAVIAEYISSWELLTNKIAQAVEIAKLFDPFASTADRAQNIEELGRLVTEATKLKAEAANRAPLAPFEERRKAIADRIRAGVNAGGGPPPELNPNPVAAAAASGGFGVAAFMQFLKEEAGAAKAQQEAQMKRLAAGLRESQKEGTKGFSSGFEDAISSFRRIQTAVASREDVPKKQLTVMEQQLLKLDAQKTAQDLTNTSLLKVLRAVEKGQVAIAG